jgi:hypothetical protein
LWKVTDGEASSTEKPPSRGSELTPGLRTKAAVDGETVLVLNHLFLEQVEGHVNALEKSTSPVQRLREVFEHWRESY